MAKKNIIEMDPTDLADVNTHEFTLSALSYLFDDAERTMKIVKKLNRKHKLFALVTLGGGLYLYKQIKELKEAVEKIDVKEEKTAE